MIVRLLVSNDKANVKKVVLRSDTVIGRSSDCNLRIASKEVSRKHCSILLSDRSVRVRDLGSANGTFLNGSQIEANVDVPAPPGSELEVGNVRFVINYDAPAPPELEASTAEVPNAVLAARIARQSPGAGVLTADPQRLVPRPEAPPPAADVLGDSSANSQLDTYRGDPAETLSDREAASRRETFNAADPDDDEDMTADGRGARPVDDDTFALKESEVADADAALDGSAESHPSRDAAETASAAAEFPAVDETISLQAEEVLLNQRPAPPGSEPAPHVAEEPHGKGWKSVFGLFGKKKPQPSEETCPASPAAAPDPDPDATRRLDPAPQRRPDPEAKRKTVPEITLPHRDEDPEANRETLPEFEPVGGQAEALDDTIQFSGDELLSRQPPGPQPAEVPAGDTNLQDFFRQLSKE